MTKSKAAAEILGNPEYSAISFGGYRGKERAKQPTIPQLKEDLKIMSAMGIKILRTYNLQIFIDPCCIANRHLDGRCQ